MSTRLPPHKHTTQTTWAASHSLSKIGGILLCVALYFLSLSLNSPRKFEIFVVARNLPKLGSSSKTLSFEMFWRSRGTRAQEPPPVAKAGFYTAWLRNANFETGTQPLSDGAIHDQVMVEHLPGLSRPWLCIYINLSTPMYILRVRVVIVANVLGADSLVKTMSHKTSYSKTNLSAILQTSCMIL